MKNILREHNIVPYAKMKAMLETHQDVAMVHATGTGKMYLGLQHIDDNPDIVHMYISPNLPILWEVEDLAKEYDVTAKIIPVTYQYLARIKDLSAEEIKKELGVNIGSIIIDEYQHSGAPIWGQGLKRIKEVYPESKRLGFTATDIRYMDNERNMTEEQFHGNIASRLMLPDAFRQGILPTPEVIIGSHSFEDEVEERLHTIDDITRSEDRNQAQEILRQAIAEIQNSSGIDKILSRHIKIKDGKMIVFCRNIKHQQAVAQIIGQWFAGVNDQTEIYTINSKIPREENYAAIRDFENSTSDAMKLLLTVDMLNGGIHPKGVTGSIMLRQIISPGLLEQQLGRVLSVGGEVPQIFDFANSIANAKETYINYVRIKDETQQGAKSTGQSSTTRPISMSSFKIIDEQADTRKMLEQLDKRLATFETTSVFSPLHTEIFRAQLAGYGLTETARLMEVSPSTVRYVMKKAQRLSGNEMFEAYQTILPPDDWVLQKRDEEGNFIPALAEDLLESEEETIEGLTEHIVDINESGFEDDVYARLFAQEAVPRYLETLTEREKRVMELRHFEGKSLEETGKEFNVQRERIRQNQQKAHRKFQGRLGREAGIFFLDSGAARDLQRKGRQLENNYYEKR